MGSLFLVGAFDNNDEMCHNTGWEVAICGGGKTNVNGLPDFIIADRGKTIVKGSPRMVICRKKP